jgi:hypothetical protein
MKKYFKNLNKTPIKIVIPFKNLWKAASFKHKKSPAFLQGF